MADMNQEGRGMAAEWLESWRGEFDIEEMMDTGRWEKYRQSVSHPATIFSRGDIERARDNCARQSWGKKVLARLLARIEKAGSVTKGWAKTYVPSTTPYSPHFTMCPKCEFARMHGAYDWYPDDPEQIVCKGCGTVYPNEDYPEDLTFHSKYDINQKITLYGGKSWYAYGYQAVHSSFSGHARIHQCRYAANTAEDLALAYALTGRKTFARSAANILRRFADVHPNYLIHSCYGDIADMDPKIAAPNVNHLPEDEWCPPGNTPNRILHPGYWAVLRWGSSGGMEGTSLQKVILAYDLIAETLSDEDRKHIEHNLLLDAATVLYCNSVINNKTGMNRCAVALIGITCGDPLLVRFGLDGFVRAVRDWWLPDGGTPESIGYAHMMLAGVWRTAEAMKQYSDPDELDLAPARIDRLDLYKWPRYRAVWQNIARPLLPNLDYPLLTDNRLPCHLSAMHADILARNYPSLNHQLLQRDIAKVPRCYTGRIAQFWYGGNLDSSAAFYRTPARLPAQPPKFVDDLGPHLNIGTLRTSERGNTGTTILYGADHKGHHHCDNLNLYYWKEGRELLTDLGYLWDMEDVRYGVTRTLSHNLVLVDEAEQISYGRRTTFHLFSSTPNAKVMEASSNVYPGASIYQRTVVTVNSGPTEYVVDVFRVRGGKTHDLVLHGPDNSLSLKGLAAKRTQKQVYDFTHLRKGQSNSPWTATWRPDGGKPFRVHVPASANETVFVGQGFGQRKAVDRGETIPYLTRRRTKKGSIFTTVYCEGSTVKSVRELYSDPRTLTLVLEITTQRGKDIVISAGPKGSPKTISLGGRMLKFDGKFGLIAGSGSILVGGTHLSLGKVTLSQPEASISGPVIETYLNEDESGLVTSGDPGHLGQIIGKQIFVTEGKGLIRTYPVLGLALSDGRPVLITRRGNDGYDIRGGDTWSAWCQTIT